MTDTEIISNILKGNRNLYRVLVERYQSLVFRTCIGFLHNKDDADDVSQDVFLQAYTSLSRFRGNSSFSTWLYRIAVNACHNRARKSRYKLFLPLVPFSEKKDLDIHVGASVSETPEDKLIAQEQREIFQKAMDSLNEKQRTAIVLSKYDDLSQKEIATIMNITEGAVEALLHRAKANLREKLMYFYKKSKRE